MLVLLSPAKSLDFESKPATRKHSEPRLLERSSELVEVMRTKTPDDLRALMGVSDELAHLNVDRFREFQTPFTIRNARAAVLAFSGDVYQGLDVAERFDERDFTEAQKTIRILSGLYGVLRPLDLIQPYRLEMGIGLATDRGKNLYDYWGDTVTELLKDDLEASPGAAAVVNLASEEYSKVVRPDVLDARVVSPRFEDVSNTGQRKVISFKAKRARGEMAGWMVRNRVRSVKALQEFSESGYRFDADASTADVPVFVRD
ncbi:peroxide stress protein YaaA [Aestuariimicrobium ganziense]|uniref:peroxide stress protein YaaA n=1 Tax=Aestuariimicrobium ganziense TaxID=2773677 RepID=UPI0019429846|nr:peroxide stress protein YaaA [Aestuariimicrobium ganziense]